MSDVKKFSGMFTAAWNFWKAHYPPKADEQWFGEMLEDARKVSGDNMFLQELLIAEQRELRRMVVNGKARG